LASRFIAISLTIVAIFAPASFMSGIAGQFFKQFGITVSALVLFSLLSARLVTPMLAAYFLRPHHQPEKAPGRLLNTYVRLVTWSVRHYFVTVFVGLLLFAASIWSVGLLSKGFLPAQDSARSVLAIELPPGSQLSDTERVTEGIAARLRNRPDIKSVFVDGGRTPQRANEVRRAGLIINYTPKSDRAIAQRELELAISRELDDVPDIRYWFTDENGLRAISLVVTGEDGKTVGNVASELANEMKPISVVANVTTDISLDRPELRIRPRTDLSVRLGVSTESLAETIRVATIGDVGPALAKFDAGDRLVPIQVQLEASARANQRVLEQLQVPMGRGGVPLTTVADVQFYQGPTSINRYDRERQAIVADGPRRQRRPRRRDAGDQCAIRHEESSQWNRCQAVGRCGDLE
jgi:multidrug efflux pump subunit AcrB